MLRRHDAMLCLTIYRMQQQSADGFTQSGRLRETLLLGAQP